MAHFKFRLILSDTDNMWGASEVYYFSGSTITSVLPVAEALAAARATVLIQDVRIVQGVLSDVAVSGDSLLTTNTPILGSVECLPDAAIQPWSAMNVRFEATSAHRGRKYFHGIKRVTFDGNRTYDVENDEAAAWTTFLDLVKSSSQLRCLVGESYDYLNITGYKPIALTEHKVGKSFFSLRGRRTTPAPIPAP